MYVDCRWGISLNKLNESMVGLCYKTIMQSVTLAMANDMSFEYDQLKAALFSSFLRHLPRPFVTFPLHEAINS